MKRQCLATKPMSEFQFHSDIRHYCKYKVGHTSDHKCPCGHKWKDEVIDNPENVSDTKTLKGVSS